MKSKEEYRTTRDSGKGGQKGERDKEEDTKGGTART